jgi:hypothetical protein
VRVRKGTLYIVYDIRYVDNPDDAMALIVCNSLKEAKREAPSYGGTYVIVKSDYIGEEIINSETIKVVS